MPRELVLALDIGATKIACGLIRGSAVIRSVKVPTGTDKGTKGIHANIRTAVEKVWIKGISRIGVGIAGSVDPRKGVFLGGPNFPKNYRNIRLSGLLRSTYRVPVRLENDARCFALGEALYGEGKGKRTVVGITIGTGIGGGIVIDRQLLRGAHGLAGEIGHMTIDLTGRRSCGCGKRGHFEAVSSGTGMENAYRSATDGSPSAFEIAERALHGDEAAISTIDAARKGLIAGISGVLHFIDPDIIVVGGGVGTRPMLWKAFMSGLRDTLAYRALTKTPIVRSSLGEKAALLGAASLPAKIRR